MFLYPGSILDCEAKSANNDADNVKSPKKPKKGQQRKSIKVSNKKTGTTKPQNMIGLPPSIPQSPSTEDMSGDDTGFISTDDDIETAADTNKNNNTKTKTGNNKAGNGSSKKKGGNAGNVNNNKKKQKKPVKRKNKKSDKPESFSTDDDNSRGRKKPSAPQHSAVAASPTAGLPPSARVVPVGDQKDIVVPLTKSPKKGAGGKKMRRRSKSPGKFKNAIHRMQ